MEGLEEKKKAILFGRKKSPAAKPVTQPSATAGEQAASEEAARAEKAAAEKAAATEAAIPPAQQTRAAALQDKQLTPLGRGMSKAERLEEGQLYCRVIIEVLGKPKEHVEGTLREFVDLIKKNVHIFTVVSEEFSEAVEQEKILFSAYAELEMWVKNITKLIGFCYDFMPSSVEIIEPESIRMTNVQLSGMFNDLQARLHDLDMVVKNTRQESMVFRKNFRTLLKNAALITLTGRDMDIKELSRVTGVKQPQLEKFMEKVLEQDERVTEKDGKFHFDVRP